MGKKIGTKITFDFDEGRTIEIETGKLASQADGSVVVKTGDTMILATVVSKKEASENFDFLPLSVDYQEKYSATGRFPGGFFKREARPSEYEILISRLTDRAIRPLFPKDYHAETQVLLYLISGDKNILPDTYVCLAASSALCISDIPFNGPVSEVRVGRINGKFIINPTVSEIAESDIDIMVAATINDIMMVEGEMKEISEEELIAALEFAHQAIKKQCKAQIELVNKIGTITKREYSHELNDNELEKKLRDYCYSKIYEVASSAIPNKHERSKAFENIKEEFISTLSEEEKNTKSAIVERYFHELHREVIRNMMLEKNIRLDGRKADEIRPIWGEVNYLPAAHGSAIFTRGETQSLTTVTLGTKLDEQIIDGAVIEGKSTFILHYNFPPFSTGEVKPIRGTSRREIGHGNLALRALKPVIPQNGDINPYTIRVVSDILESNGSSSMATVCAGTLALMDAGVKISKPVSGIAMGLISDDKGRYMILSDILGDEDHLGDMDFKITGTIDGITACQMDIKMNGLPYNILKQALDQAKKGRLHILKEMEKIIDKPRDDYKPFVPRIEKLMVPKEFIGAIIGPGGKIIQEIQTATNTTIIIDEVGDFGIVDIFSSKKEDIDAAKAKIRAITAIPEVGEVYVGEVKNIQPFGAFVEILPGKDGLLHISEIDWKRISDINNVLKIGDKIKVKLIEIDKNGKMKLSRKALIPKQE